MIKVALVDDNKRDLSVMQAYLAKAKENEYPDLSVDSYTDSLEFFDNFQGRYDIVFLDIEMPLLDGMELARKLRKIGSDCCIIFITNMPQYALQGYEVEAIAYLIKPVKYFNFSQILKKAVERTKTRREGDASVVINTRQEVKVLPSSTILYVEVENHNLVFHTTDGGEYRTRESLKAVEEQLAGMNFCRCNNCYLVNLRYVDSVVGSTVKVGGADLLMSRHKKKEFVEKYMKYTR